jgi:hypothetical protein
MFIRTTHVGNFANSASRSLLVETSVVDVWADASIVKNDRLARVKNRMTRDRGVRWQRQVELQMATLINTKDLRVHGLCIRVAELAVSPELNGVKKRWFADHRFSLCSG